MIGYNSLPFWEQNTIVGTAGCPALSIDFTCPSCAFDGCPKQRQQVLFIVATMVFGVADEVFEVPWSISKGTVSKVAPAGMGFQHVSTNHNALRNDTAV